MGWGIVADSSCNMRSYIPDSSDCRFYLAPLKINVAGTEYVDDDQLDMSVLHAAIRDEETATSSACPSAGEWADLFRHEDNVIAITISSGVSGSYDAACLARNMVLDEYAREHDGVIAGKNIYVLNSRAAGAKLEVLVKLIDRFIGTGADFDAVISYAKELEEHAQVLYSLSSYDNLVKNGRLPRIVGTVASKLNIRMLGTASAEGTLKVVGPTRGEKKMIRKIVDTMESDGYRGGCAFIDHVENESGANAVKDAIIARWPNADVSILPCGGLCSYYAELSGLIIGFEWL